jgi:hypothetical protein
MRPRLRLRDLTPHVLSAEERSCAMGWTEECWLVVGKTRPPASSSKSKPHTVLMIHFPAYIGVVKIKTLLTRNHKLR